MFDMKYSSKQPSPYKHFFICVMAACVILALILLVAAMQTETEHVQAATAMILAVAVILLLFSLLLLLALLLAKRPPAKSHGRRQGMFLVDLLDEENYLNYSQLELTAEVLKTQAQMNSLQSQINPHFLYNTLESIRSKALLHDAEEVAAMIETLARLLRYNISRSDKESSISDELENVKNYIQIQNYRFRGKFTLKLELDALGDLLENYMLPTLTLQPIVENAIHHGLEPQIGPGTITIRGFQTEDKVILQIQDDGVGMSPERLAELRDKLFRPDLNQPLPHAGESGSRHGAGIALKNVHQRLQLLFGTGYGLEIVSAAGVGTQVELCVPAPCKTEKIHHEERTV